MDRKRDKPSASLRTGRPPQDLEGGLSYPQKQSGKSRIDDEQKKKLSITPWRQRQRIHGIACVMTLLLALAIGVTTRGYHRRHKDRQQRIEWNKFRQKVQRGQNDGLSRMHMSTNDEATDHRKDEGEKHEEDSDFLNRTSYLQNNQEVAQKWEEHLVSNDRAAKLFEDEQENSSADSPELSWQPEGNPWDEAADQLGAAVEHVGEEMHDLAEKIVGPNVADSVGSAIHNVLDTTGEWADDLSDSELSQVVQNALGSVYGATTQTVAEWMKGGSLSGNETEEDMMLDWSDWTQSFLRAPTTLWNYTLEQLAAFDDVGDAEEEDKESEDFDETKREMFQSVDGGDRPTAGRNRTTKTSLKPLPQFMEDEGGEDAGNSMLAFITSGPPGMGEQDTWRFETFILGALKTYLSHTVLFYIVNQHSRASVIEKTCAASIENQKACTRLITIYVACPGSDYGISTCCQQDRGMAQIAKNYPKFDWYIFHQDDLYFRLDYLQAFVSGLPNPQVNALMLSASPFRAHGSILPELREREAAGRSMLAGFTSNCSSSPNHIYPWGNPAVVYSNAALQMVLPGYENWAVTKECAAFKVPAAAAGPIVHWMYQLPLVRMPLIAAHPPTDLARQLFSPEEQLPPLENNSERQQVVSLTVRGANGQVTRKSRPNGMQRLIAFRVQLGRANFTDLHEQVQTARRAAQEYDQASNSNKATKLYPDGPYPYRFHRPTGFTETEIYQQHGPPQNWTNWHEFGPQHCIRDARTSMEDMLAQRSERDGHNQRPQDTLEGLTPFDPSRSAINITAQRIALERMRLHQQRLGVDSMEGMAQGGPRAVMLINERLQERLAGLHAKQKGDVRYEKRSRMTQKELDAEGAM